VLREREQAAVRESIATQRVQIQDGGEGKSRVAERHTGIPSRAAGGRQWAKQDRNAQQEDAEQSSQPERAAQVR